MWRIYGRGGGLGVMKSVRRLFEVGGSINQRGILVHPAIQPYRGELFAALSHDPGLHFLFVGWASHNRLLLPQSRIHSWEVLDDRSWLRYRQGVNFAVAYRAAQGRYRYWVASTINCFPTHVAFPIVSGRRRPFLLWTEDWWWPSGLEGQVAALYGRRILRGADAVIAAGSRARDFASANGARYVFVAHNATENLGRRPWQPMDVKGLRRALGLEGKFVVLFLNDIIPVKGLDILLHAFARLRHSVPSTHLLIVGDGFDRAACERLATELRLADVTFMGERAHDEIHLFYRLADAYIHPARFVDEGRVRGDAWGFTINEALSIGCPVITTTAVGGAQDLIVPDRSGIIVRAGDPDSLAQAMIRLVKNPAQRSDIGAAGRRRAEQFTPQRQYQEFRAALTALGLERNVDEV